MSYSLIQLATATVSPFILLFYLHVCGKKQQLYANITNYDCIVFPG